MRIYKQGKNISIRKFEEKDVSAKVEWINNPQNNKYLHYDLPLENERTLAWYKNIRDRTDRYDGVIEVDGIAVGLIGLLSIDENNRKAELYVCICDNRFRGQGIAKESVKLIIGYAFTIINLKKVYLYTEIENIAAQQLFESVGFKKEVLLKKDLFYNGKYIDRYVYGMFSEHDTV